jgi:hypothetical protein
VDTSLFFEGSVGHPPDIARAPLSFVIRDTLLRGRNIFFRLALSLLFDNKRIGFEFGRRFYVDAKRWDDDGSAML